MDNAIRAKRLAELGFFHIESRMAQSLAAGDGVLDGDILLSLLSELAIRGMYPSLKYLDCWVGGVVSGIPWTAKGHCPLTAVVDAVIAAHAERQAT